MSKHPVLITGKIKSNLKWLIFVKFKII
jgi:hypothetical protein